MYCTVSNVLIASVHRDRNEEREVIIHAKRHAPEYAWLNHVVPARACTACHATRLILQVPLSLNLEAHQSCTKKLYCTCDDDEGRGTR